jgi:hypothetical protein
MPGCCVNRALALPDGSPNAVSFTMPSGNRAKHDLCERSFSVDFTLRHSTTGWSTKVLAAFSPATLGRSNR